MFSLLSINRECNWGFNGCHGRACCVGINHEPLPATELPETGFTGNDLRQYQLQTFTNGSGTEVNVIEPPVVGNYSDVFFNRLSAGAVRFTCPVDGVRTSLTAGGPRVELRQVYKFGDTGTPATPRRDRLLDSPWLCTCSASLR